MVPLNKGTFCSSHCNSIVNNFSSAIIFAKLPDDAEKGWLGSFGWFDIFKDPNATSRYPPFDVFKWNLEKSVMYGLHQTDPE